MCAAPDNEVMIAFIDGDSLTEAAVADFFGNVVRLLRLLYVEFVWPLAKFEPCDVCCSPPGPPSPASPFMSDVIFSTLACLRQLHSPHPQLNYCTTLLAGLPPLHLLPGLV